MVVVAPTFYLKILPGWVVVPWLWVRGEPSRNQDGPRDRPQLPRQREGFAPLPFCISPEVTSEGPVFL